MTEALGYIYTIFDRFITFIFNDMALFPGVTFGWICITIIIFYYVLSNLLTIPSVGHGKKERGTKKHG